MNSSVNNGFASRNADVNLMNDLNNMNSIDIAIIIVATTSPSDAHSAHEQISPDPDDATYSIRIHDAALGFVPPSTSLCGIAPICKR